MSKLNELDVDLHLANIGRVNSRSPLYRLMISRPFDPNQRCPLHKKIFWLRLKSNETDIRMNDWVNLFGSNPENLAQLTCLSKQDLLDLTLDTCEWLRNEGYGYWDVVYLQ